MENRDCILKVKYSIIVDSGSGKNKLLKKKTEKKLSTPNTVAILEEIDSFENNLKYQNEVSKTLSNNRIFQYIKKFFKTWKYSYYEMLNI